VTRHEQAPRPSGVQLRIAIVDDDARVLRSLKELVESAPDLEVVSTVGRADEAIFDDMEHPSDLVLLDLMLPTEAEGMRVLRVLRDRNRPVIAISVLGALRQRALAEGAFAFVEKDGRELDGLHDTIRAAARSG
jgi:DNA-binding NarL/FixJ family response regulator